MVNFVSGRDGLTHNMLDNIHAHWKRRRVCKIKCKGVCTVDMDNVKQQLEVKIFVYSSYCILLYLYVWLARGTLVLTYCEPTLKVYVHNLCYHLRMKT